MISVTNLRRALRRFLLTSVAAALLLSGYQPAQAAPPPGYQLEWSEEFHQGVGAKPDPAVWGYNTGGGGWGNGELETYVSDLEHAQIVAAPGATDGQALQILSTNTHGYESARMLTQGKKTFQYGFVEAPRPRQRLIHCHADPDELGRVFEADLAINAAPAHLAAGLDGLEPVDGTGWNGWARAAHDEYLASLRPSLPGGALDLAAIVGWLSDTLPEDAILCNGAGNFAAWLHRFFQYKTLGTQLAPTSGAMGYGLPAGVAAKLRFPDRTVVVFAGDGDFSMSAPELATAVQYGAAIVVVVVNNGMLATIRMHQEQAYPGRPIATALRNPDFVALARAYGAHGALVERTADFAPAFARARASGLPALLELRVDPELISTRATLASLGSEAAQRAHRVAVG